MDLLEGLGSLLGLAFIVGIPLVLLFYFLRWIAAYFAREADEEEAFKKELR